MTPLPPPPRPSRSQEREKSAWPYRVLATNNGYGENERFVVLKREPNHFVLLTAVVPAQPPQAVGIVAGNSEGGGGDEDGREPGGGGSTSSDVVPVPTASTVTSKRGVSCFRRYELPDVVRKLWRI